MMDSPSAVIFCKIGLALAATSWVLLGGVLPTAHQWLSVQELTGSLI